MLKNLKFVVIDRHLKYLLELCKLMESMWNGTSNEERLALLKRACSNFRLDGLKLYYDLKKPFKKLLPKTAVIVNKKDIYTYAVPRLIENYLQKSFF